jgi:hypothetical protein
MMVRGRCVADEVVVVVVVKMTKDQPLTLK